MTHAHMPDKIPAKSIRVHIFRAMFLLGIGILILSSIVSVVMLRENWHQQVFDSFRHSFGQFNAMVELRMEELNQLSYSLINNANIKAMFIGNYADRYEEYTVHQSVESLLTSLLAQHNQLRICLIFTGEGSVYTNFPSDSSLSQRTTRLSFRNHSIDMDAFQKTDWYIQGEKLGAGALQYIDNFELPGFSAGAQPLTMICRFVFSGKKLGYIAVSIEDEWLKPLFDTPYGNDVNIILSASGNVLYAYGEPPESLLEQAAGYLSRPSPFEIRIDGWHGYIVQHMWSKSCNLYLLTANSLTPLENSLFRALMIYALFSIGLAGIVLLSSICQSRHIADPIAAIVREIETSEQDIRLSPIPGAASEIQWLVRCLNQMSLRIHLLINDMLETHTMKKNMEIYALKQQINPHFLYNIIETINSMALIHDCQDIGSVASHLGSMLRYSLERRNDIVPLSMEITHLSDYLAINRIRGLTFEARIIVDEALLDTPVPRLILQPLVENCFKHGFRGKAKGALIIITASRREQALLLRIEDNGAGFDPDQREEILRSLDRHQGGSPDTIGLYNVHRRIRLAFGAEYGLTIHAPSEGACIDLILPIEEVDKDETFEGICR